MVRATLRRRPDSKSCIVFWKYEPAGPFYDSDRENSQDRSVLRLLLVPDSAPVFHWGDIHHHAHEPGRYEP